MTKLEQLIKEFCPNGVEFKNFWKIANFNKRFNGVEKHKQEQVLKFYDVSAEQLKQIATTDGDITLLSTGNFTGKTNSFLAENFLNNDEVITIPTGGIANLKYHNGKFVSSGNILVTAKKRHKFEICISLFVKYK